MESRYTPSVVSVSVAALGFHVVGDSMKQPLDKGMTIKYVLIKERDCLPRNELLTLMFKEELEFQLACSNSRFVQPYVVTAHPDTQGQARDCEGAQRLKLYDN